MRQCYGFVLLGCGFGVWFFVGILCGFLVVRFVVSLWCKLYFWIEVYKSAYRAYNYGIIKKDAVAGNYERLGTAAEKAAGKLQSIVLKK